MAIADGYEHCEGCHRTCDPERLHTVKLQIRKTGDWFAIVARRRLCTDCTNRVEAALYPMEEH